MTFIGLMALWPDDDEIISEVASLGSTYVEIGTLFGASAIIAGEAGCEVFCIDPLDGYYSTKHKDVLRPEPISGLVPSEEIVRKNWESAGLDPDKLHICPQLHPPWPTEIDRTFDAGLIDGDHEFPGVLADYIGMSPRVKYLMFHDKNKPHVTRVLRHALGGGLWKEYAKSSSHMAVLERVK